MSSEPSSPGFIDPNARLLASVIPPPPPTLSARVARFVTTRSSGDLRSVVRWSRSREGRSCFFAALAGVALTLALYRSESSSAASANSVMPHAERPSTPLSAGASVRSKPLALTPNSPAASASAGPHAAGSVTASAAASDAIDAELDDDASDDAAPTGALRAADESDDALRPAPRKKGSAKIKGKGKGKGKKLAKHARKAKRQSVARGSSRKGRRAKNQRPTAAGPLAAWLATQRSKDASPSKPR